MKNQDKTISVIVPIYNVKPYLNEFMESVVAQTYSNLEIILVDDGSSDGSGLICDAWSEKDKRIRVVHQENKGLSGARNTGLDCSTGELLAFADPDDLLHPEMYEILAEALSQNKVQMSVCMERAFYETEQVSHKAVCRPCMVEILDRQELLGRLNSNFPGQVTWVWNKLYTRELIGQKRFAAVRTLEDIFFSTDIICDVECVSWINERLYYYRQRQTSLMNQKNYGRLLDYMRACGYVYEKVAEYGSSDKQDGNLYKYLNRLANLEACAYGCKEEAIYSTIRGNFIQQFDGSRSKIKSRKEYLKLILARRTPFIYYILKNQRGNKV